MAIGQNQLRRRSEAENTVKWYTRVHLVKIVLKVFVYFDENFQWNRSHFAMYKLKFVYIFFYSTSSTKKKIANSIYFYKNTCRKKTWVNSRSERFSIWDCLIKMHLILVQRKDESLQKLPYSRYEIKSFPLSSLTRSNFLWVTAKPRYLIN